MSTVQKRFDELWAERSHRLWSDSEINELFDLVRAGAQSPGPMVTISGSPSPETARAMKEMIGLVHEDRFNAAASKILVERASLLQRLAKYEAAEAEEARIQKELNEEHARIQFIEDHPDNPLKVMRYKGVLSWWVHGAEETDSPTARQALDKAIAAWPKTS